MTIITDVVDSQEQRTLAMQLYVYATSRDIEGLNLFERIARNGSVAGLGGVALSGLAALLPMVPHGSSIQWACGIAGAVFGIAAAFFPRRPHDANRVRPA